MIYVSMNKNTNNFKQTFTQVIREVLSGQNIDRVTCGRIFKGLLNNELGEANQASLGAYLASLQAKKPTKDEILGLMDVVMKHDRLIIKSKYSNRLCAIVGSGKDEIKTFNISTGASLVAASAGAYVIKHGSRSESGPIGTTDIMEALGVNIKPSEERIDTLIEKHHYVFCDVASYFPRMAHQFISKILFMHPLSYILSIASPIPFKHILFGLASWDTELVGELLCQLNIKQFAVVAGRDSMGRYMDEISILGTTKITTWNNKKKILNTFYLNPSQLDLPIGKIREIMPEKSQITNALKLKDVLSGKLRHSARNAIILNAGMLLLVGNVVDTLREGVDLSRYVIDKGIVIKHLANYTFDSNL